MVKGRGRKERRGSVGREELLDSLIPLLIGRRVRVYLENGEVIEGRLDRVSKYDMLIVTNPGNALGYVIIHKGHFTKIEPLE